MTRLSPGVSVGGRFQVRALIGAGDMGEVYEVLDQSSNTLAALKLFTAPEANEAILGQLEQLAQRAGQTSPVFARFLARGNDSHGLFVVSEQVSLPSLARLVDQHMRLPLPMVGQLLTQVAAALDVVHAAGLAHGDLKPQNVFYPAPGESGRPKITDFGVSSLRAVARAPWPGTPGWVAPEQAQSGIGTPSTDVYSLAALGFYALTGTPYFLHARSPTPELNALWDEMHQPVNAVSRATELGIALPSVFEEVFQRGLTSDAMQRYARASELAEAFARAAEQGRTNAAAVQAASASKPVPSRRRPRFEGTMVMDEDVMEKARAFMQQQGVTTESAPAPQPAAGIPAPRPAAGAPPPRPAAGAPPPRPAAGAPPPRPAAGAPPPRPAAGVPAQPPPVQPPPAFGEAAPPPMANAPPPAMVAAPAPGPAAPAGPAWGAAEPPPPVEAEGGAKRKFAGTFVAEAKDILPDFAALQAAAEARRAAQGGSGGAPVSAPAAAPPPMANAAPPAPQPLPAMPAMANAAPEVAPPQLVNQPVLNQQPLAAAAPDYGMPPNVPPSEPPPPSDRSPARNRPFAQTSYAPAAFDMPSMGGTTDLDVVLRDERPLFGKRTIFIILGIVFFVMILGALLIWSLLRMDEPVDFPAQPSSALTQPAAPRA